MTIIQAVIGDDGRLLVTVEWPDGQSRVLDRDEAVLLSLNLLDAASRLFETAAEFAGTIKQARGKIEPLEPCSTVQ
jgi:hypothetical protein